MGARRRLVVTLVVVVHALLVVAEMVPLLVLPAEAIR